MTNTFSTHFNNAWLNKLLSAPDKITSGIYLNTAYEAKVIIPHYKQQIATHYHEIIKGNLDQVCRQYDMPAVFKHFGVIIHFKKPLQIHLHDNEMNMVEIHHIIRETGALIIKNAYLDSEHRSMGHRNRFPQLNFHVDRSVNQPTHYSMYTRNPYDEEQKHPRKSSTLFISSIIGHLQAIKENQLDEHNQGGNKGSYVIFLKENINELINNIMVEHAWNEPLGTGEISIIDNITCLHASYYPNSAEKGYKIGVRYVA
ncbi:MAG: hypothetical protein OEW97_06315 [Gammaproteobacteria bacterium]|nr:hypothetical protein [Gammaproteobacteria bacterium]